MARVVHTIKIKVDDPETASRVFAANHKCWAGDLVGAPKCFYQTTCKSSFATTQVTF